MANREKNYTPSGNVRAPSKTTCLWLVRQAWESTSEEIACKSFKACGISVKLDRSADKEIDCLKSSSVAEDVSMEIAR